MPPFVVPRFYEREMPRAIRRGRAAHGVWHEMTHLLGKHLFVWLLFGHGRHVVDQSFSNDLAAIWAQPEMLRAMRQGRGAHSSYADGAG